jgi:hypothetical protein
MDVDDGGTATESGHGAKADGGDPVLLSRKIIAGIVLWVIALALWAGRDAVSSWFATSYTATIELVTVTERDDARVRRAFDAAHAAQPGDATFEVLPSLSLVRHSAVHVTGPSSGAAISTAGSLSRAIAAAFEGEGPGRLDARVPRRAFPVPDPASISVRAVLMITAPALGLCAIMLFWQAWSGWTAGSGSGARQATFLGIGAAGFLSLAFAMPAWAFMALFALAIPGAIAAKIVWKTREVQRAALWPSAQGRIVCSQMRAVRRRRTGEATAAGNMPYIEYVYSAGGVEYRGHRIGIGDISTDSPQAQAALDCYPEGRTVPVYYNPADPGEAVLDRSAPASPAAMYGLAAGVVLTGLAAVAAFTDIARIIAWLQPFFPEGAVIQGVLFCAAAGLLISLFFLSELRTAMAAARWPAAAGTILSSVAESRYERVGGARSGQRVLVWSPVVEYGYRVGGRDYHGTRVSFGAAVSGPRELAEAAVARYPAGRAVTVHFDPGRARDPRRIQLADARDRRGLLRGGCVFLRLAGLKSAGTSGRFGGRASHICDMSERSVR